LRELINRLSGDLLHAEVNSGDPPDCARIFQRDLAGLIWAPEISEQNAVDSASVGIARIVFELDLAKLHRLGCWRFGVGGG
jgi:hypothetical protein